MKLFVSKNIRIILGCILVFTIISVCFTYMYTRKTINQNSAEEKFDNNYLSKNHQSKSPNEKITAELVSENGKSFDSVLITANNDHVLIPLEDIFYTTIEYANWVDNTRFAICGHINPSLEVYILIDVNKTQISGKYYGIGFTWNKSKNRLYYIEPSSHFSEPTSDKIVDSEEHIYYETRKEESILDKLAISDDEQIFAFYINNSANETRKLIIAKMNKNKKLEAHTIINAQFGDIKFNNNNSIETIVPGGNIYHYDISP